MLFDTDCRYIQTNASTGGLNEYKPFIEWWFRYLSGQADPATGLWCSEAQRMEHGELNCLTESFHIDFVFEFASLHPAFGDGAGNSTRFPFAAVQLNTSLALQNKRHGGWSASGLEYMDVDGIWQATRPSIQLGKARKDLNTVPGLYI